MTPAKGTSASLRARRLLALLHLLEQDTTHSIGTIAEMLGSSEVEISQDLDALACCGVAPYYPDQLVPVFIEDGVVEVFGPLPALARSVRLSLAEAKALAAALQAAGMSVDHPLAARLLAAAAPSGVDPADLERVVRAAAAGGSGALPALAAGLRERRTVAIAYRAAGRDVETERVIEPLALVAERGAWYVEAFCRRAGALRTFRVDRVREAQLLDEHFGSRAVEASGVVFSTDELPHALLRFAQGEEFTERDWPGARVVASRPDGSIDVEVPFAGTQWVARHVVARLGSVEVLAPAEVRDAVTDLAASALREMRS